jgi:hypothetical protein
MFVQIMNESCHLNDDKNKFNFLDGCNIQIMDENNSKWIKLKMK